MKVWKEQPWHRLQLEHIRPSAQIPYLQQRHDSSTAVESTTTAETITAGRAAVSGMSLITIAFATTTAAITTAAAQSQH
jgi:hypothetical protein